jgi:hypothetical protein
VSEPIGTFEKQRAFTTERFTISADRMEKPFVLVRSGLSHGGGHIQYILSPEEARELANELLHAAAFAATPLPKWGK